jgi:hypothetical protein
MFRLIVLATALESCPTSLIFDVVVSASVARAVSGASSKENRFAVKGESLFLLERPVI